VAETPPSPASPSHPSSGGPASPGPEQPYQALYRRYRPRRFSEVRGQDHVTRALRNAVREGRVAHAYLFSGPRGTGKTSTARILAMALNCESPEGGEPDGTCLSCRSVRSGASMDVFELDAASNRKLDEMRELLSRVALGTPGRWKVYIIDEVHQLTSDAASALLKTLEEPPSHVVFVLATTDPQKVLPTILSRAQHFEFHLLDGQVLTDLLSEVNTDAGLGLSTQAVRLAVERGRGSARDAESALEQLAAAGESEDDTAPLSELIDALADYSVDRSLRAVALAISGGRDPRRLGNDLVEYMRNAFLAHQAPSLVLWPSGATAQLAEQATKMGLPYLVRCMEALGQALADMRDAVDPRVTLEVALIQLASPGTGTSMTSLLERIERLERRLAPSSGPSPAPAPLAPPTPGASQSAPGPRAQASSPLASRPAATSPTLPANAPAAPATGPTRAKAALGAILKGDSPSPQASAPPSANATIQLGETAPPSPARPQSSAATSLVLPTRDALTKAWGDTVLTKLSRQAQVYMARGRFTEVTNGAAVFALPDRGWLERASNFAGEAENALAGYFGQPVPLCLVIDKGAVPAASPAAGTQETYDLDELSELSEASSVPALPVEQRILEAFPGSVLDS